MVGTSKRQKLQKRTFSNEEVDMTRDDSNGKDNIFEPLNKKLTLTMSEKEKECNKLTTANSIIQQKLDTALNKIQHMTQEISSLVNEVGELKTELQHMKNVLFDKEQIEDIKTEVEEPSPSADQSTTSFAVATTPNNKIAPMTGPFPKYEPIHRVLHRPSSKDLVASMGRKAHSLQFTCNLYVDLIEKTLGPMENSNLDYRAMVKEAVLLTKAVLSDLKELHNIDPNLRWSYVEPAIKLEGYRKLENATEHLLPLKVCSEFWGAHVLISNFWLKRKKSTNSKKKQEQQPQQQQDNNQQRLMPKAFSIPFLTHQ